MGVEWRRGQQRALRRISKGLLTEEITKGNKQFRNIKSSSPCKAKSSDINWIPCSPPLPVPVACSPSPDSNHYNGSIIRATTLQRPKYHFWSLLFPHPSPCSSQAHIFINSAYRGCHKSILFPFGPSCSSGPSHCHWQPTLPWVPVPVFLTLPIY